MGECERVWGWKVGKMEGGMDGGRDGWKDRRMKGQEDGRSPSTALKPGRSSVPGMWGGAALVEHRRWSGPRGQGVAFPGSTEAVPNNTCTLGIAYCFCVMHSATNASGTSLMFNCCE